MFMMHNHQWRLVFSVCSQLIIRLFLINVWRKEDWKGKEATVSSDSLNIVINMSINHSRLGGGREDEDFGGHHYLEGGGQWSGTVEGGGGNSYTIDRK